MGDVFNNPTNNYVNPNLSPCAGAGDDSFLEFLPNDQIGIVQGSNILASISFSDIKIPITGYSTQKKVLEPGEVVFIPGLTKGLSYRSQSFKLLEFNSTDEDLNPFFMKADVSVGFYKNFKYYLFNLEASANYANNVNIADALNVALSNIQAKITSGYDPSDLSFTGTQLGWDFNIYNIELTLIDTSENSLSPFPNMGDIQDFVLEEDLEKMVLYAKYPNSAMQGILLKASYPADESPYNKWFQINHVTDMVTIYEPIQIDNFITNLQKTVTITFDSSITFGPFIGDNSLGVTYFQEDVSIASINEFIFDCSVLTSDLIDSSIYGSNLSLSSTLMTGVLENSWINKDNYFPYGDPSNKVMVAFSTINDCSISNASITDSSIFKSLFFGDSSVVLTNCTLYNCTYDPSLVHLINCTIVRINESIDCSISYDMDSSLYYTPIIKTIEVGMSGCSTSTAMTGGDYLEWITENQDWKKVGDLYIWTSAPDADDTRNLIDGFYAFNPQEFNIQIEYLIFV